MNAIEMARTAYSSHSAPIKSHRSTEYDAFVRITRQMTAAQSRGAAGFSQLVAALHENRKLWTWLATSVADADNALPQSLRARLFYLAEFTLQHSDKVLAGTAAPDILIELNTTVMRGLRQSEMAA